MNRLIFIFLTVNLIILKAPADPAQQPTTSDCEPVTEVRQNFQDAHIMPGEYVITLVATKGERSGSAVGGRMWLRPTSPRDKSPRTGESAPANEDRKKVPLYGAVDVNLSLVDAPMDAGDGIAPQSMSRDPIYPGVLVHVVDFYNAPKGQIVLTIGTLSNHRTDKAYTDGAGIGLFVEKLDDDAFAGSWRPWGILMGGSGHFCARLVSK